MSVATKNVPSHRASNDVVNASYRGLLFVPGKQVQATVFNLKLRYAVRLVKTVFEPCDQSVLSMTEPHVHPFFGERYHQLYERFFNHTILIARATHTSPFTQNIEINAKSKK
jgi:hypothetical protein